MHARAVCTRLFVPLPLTLTPNSLGTKLLVEYDELVQAREEEVC